MQQIIDGDYIVTTFDNGSTARELRFTPDSANYVPQSVSMRQARLALLGAGLLSTVEAAIAAQDEPIKTQLSIEFEYATEVARNWPTLLALQPALGMTDEQVDQLFITASQL